MTGSVFPELLLATAVPPADGGPTVIILVAVVTVVGTIATALGPTLVEIVKSRRAGGTPPAPTAPGAEVAGDAPVSLPPSPDNPLTPVVQSGIDALGMVNAAVQDYRNQRDDALRRVDQLQGLLDDARATIGQQLVELTQLHARLARYEPEAPPDPYGRQQPMYPPDPRYGDWRPR